MSIFDPLPTLPELPSFGSKSNKAPLSAKLFCEIYKEKGSCCYQYGKCPYTTGRD